MKPSTFQFKNPILNTLVFRENDHFNKDEFTGIRIESSTKVKRGQQANQAIVELGLEIGDNKDAPFYIDIKMSSKFVWENQDEKDIEKLLRSNAPAVLLSYMRPIVANITENSKYPVLNIPFMNFTENIIDEDID